MESKFCHRITKCVSRSVDVDDVLHQHYDPDILIKALEQIYRLKENSTGEYLGSNIETEDKTLFNRAAIKLTESTYTTNLA